jgi:outer membrane lipoprotein-sorting protein
MLVKEKFYKPIVIKKTNFLTKIILVYLLLTNIVYADLKKNLIDKLILTETLTFNFEQKIGGKEETGNCFIKYPLLIKCNYQNIKQKTLISNGKTVAIIKKKYKKIYYYPLKSTPLFIILDKVKVLNLIKKNEPSIVDLDILAFEFIDEKSNKIKIFFDKNTLELKGWKTKDIYSNNVSFIISNLKTNNQIMDDFFQIPKENDL